MDQPHYSLGDARSALEHLDELCRLFDAVFLRVPFEWSSSASADNRAELVSLCADESFTIALAWSDCAIIGMAYGIRLPVSHGWWNDFTVELSPDMTRERPGRTFAVITLAVAPAFRRRGVATELVRRLLAGRPEERAILSVQPSADAAHRFYCATGWTLVGRKGPLPKVTPPYWDIYVTSLLSDKA